MIKPSETLDEWFYRHSTTEPDYTQTLILHETYGWEDGAKPELQALLDAAVAEARKAEAERIKMEYYEYLPPHAKINFDRDLAALRTTGNGQAGQEGTE